MRLTTCCSLFFDPELNPRPNGLDPTLGDFPTVIANVFAFYRVGVTGTYVLEDLLRLHERELRHPRHNWVGIGVCEEPNTGSNSGRYPTKYHTTIILVQTCALGIGDPFAQISNTTENCGPFLEILDDHPALKQCIIDANFDSPIVFTTGTNEFLCSNQEIDSVSGLGGGGAEAPGCLHTDVNLKNRLMRMQICQTFDIGSGNGFQAWLTQYHGQVKVLQIRDFPCGEDCIEVPMYLSEEILDMILKKQLELTIFRTLDGVIIPPLGGVGRVPCIILDPFIFECEPAGDGLPFPTCDDCNSDFSTWCHNLENDRGTLAASFIVPLNFTVCLGECAQVLDSCYDAPEFA